MIGSKSRRSDGPLSTSFSRLLEERPGRISGLRQEPGERRELGHGRARLGHELAEVGGGCREPVEEPPAVRERRAERLRGLGELRLAVGGRREEERGAIRCLAKRLGVGGKGGDDALPLADRAS